MTRTYARRPKASHRGTVDYEIEMLYFSSQRLMKRRFDEEKDEYVYLEAFLLHYRNLVRFFSGEQHRENMGDISVANPKAWMDREFSSKQIASIQEPARELDRTYHGDISKYLQHCTRARSERGKVWDVVLMTQEITPIIEAFESSFPRRSTPRAGKRRPDFR